MASCRAENVVRLLGRYLNSGTETQKIRDLCDRAASEHIVRGYSPPTAAPKRLSPAINERITELYEQGKRPADIAREVGTTEWTVHHRLNRMGVERRPVGLSPSHVLEATRLYELGESIRQIRLKIGFSDKTIKKALIAAGIDVQDRRKKS